MPDQKHTGSVGIYIDGAKNVSLLNNKIDGFDNGIIARNINGLRAEGNQIIAPTGDTVPRELIELTVQILADKQQSTRSALTPKDAEEAAEKSGLKSWLIDKSVDIANLGVTLLTLVTR